MRKPAQSPRARLRPSIRPAAPTRPRLIRRLVQGLEAYVPGEQPKLRGIIKLNTNENPFPPSPKVLAAVRAAIGPGLRLYPNPTSAPLRQALARLHSCRPDQVIVGNGSDELLALATRAFVEPAPAKTPTARAKTVGAQNRIQYFDPSYSLYPVLAAIHGAIGSAQPLQQDFDLPSPAQLRRSAHWNFKAALTFITTPNAPSGRGYSLDQLDALCNALRGVVVLDEAYADFADCNALPLALRHPHVLVARTFSKGYSLCFQRVGYMIGHPQLIAALDKIRDSYNVNGLGQVGALATLAHLDYYRRGQRNIIATREWLTRRLRAMDFEVFPSQTNFLLLRPPGPPAREWFERLRARKILVRWFDRPGIRNYLRVTIGTRAQMKAFLAALR